MPSKKELKKAAEFYQNMKMANAISHQQALNQIEIALVAKASQLILSSDAEDFGSEKIAAMLEMLKELKQNDPNLNH
jgi:hypothetical protein